MDWTTAAVRAREADVETIDLAKTTAIHYRMVQPLPHATPRISAES